MKRYETPYNEYGWKIVLIKGKDITQIYLRSRRGHHRTQKPFYLRLDDENFLKLVQLMSKAVTEELKSSDKEKKNA